MRLSSFVHGPSDAIYSMTSPRPELPADIESCHALIEQLQAAAIVATHVEVDRQPKLAATHLGGASIPMSYALRDGAIVAELRGQRSADETLLACVRRRGVDDFKEACRALDR